MSRLRFLPYLGALLLVLGVIALVLAVLVVPESMFSLALAAAILAVVAGILCLVFGLLLPVFGRAAIPPAEVLGAATAAGRLAPARVISVYQNGVRLGPYREFTVDLVVAPTDRPAYRGRQYLRTLAKHWDAVGPLVTVIRVEADDPRVVLVKDAAGTDQSQQVPLDAAAWSN